MLHHNILVPKTHHAYSLHQLVDGTVSPFRYLISIHLSDWDRYRLNMRAYILQGGSVEAADHFSVDIPMRPVHPLSTQATAEEIVHHQA